MGLMVVALVGANASGSLPWPIRAGVCLAFLVVCSLILWHRDRFSEHMRMPLRSNTHTFWVYTLGPAFGAVVSLLGLIASLTDER